ncbi:MAG: hypothetical protein QG608_138 [Actinomycetota bacterium]|nr:hypothetical protein [Actinomycetota bacterium]
MRPRPTPLRHPEDRGSIALELAFVSPLLLALIFFSIQTGLWWYGRTVALQAAREGVTQLRLVPDSQSFDQIVPQVERNTEDFASVLGKESLVDPDAEADFDEDNGRVSMTVTGHVMTLVPGMDLQVTQQAFGEVERFEADR